MFHWLFSWIFTYYAFAILALICNFNLHGLSPTLHQEYSTRPKLLWVMQLWLDSFLCGLHHHVGDALVNSIYFFKWLWKFCNFFLLLSLSGNFDAEPHPHLSVTAVQRIPAMPNAEEEKRRRCRQKVEVYAPVSPFPQPVFPLNVHLIPSQVPSPVSPFSLSRYTSESPSYPFPSTCNRRNKQQIYN